MVDSGPLGLVTSLGRSVARGVASEGTTTIGGKLLCDPPTVDCGYFAGDLDFVRVERGL
jgi:hypothetical protein